MSCECGSKGARKHSPAGGRVVLPVLQTRAAMCAACPRRSDETCGETRRACVLMVAKNECPRGRFPGKGGLIRWMGLDWRGVPWPVRVWLHVIGRISHPEALPECGCIDRLKRWTEKVFGSAKPSVTESTVTTADRGGNIINMIDRLPHADKSMKWFVIKNPHDHEWRVSYSWQPGDSHNGPYTRLQAEKFRDKHNTDNIKKGMTNGLHAQ